MGPAGLREGQNFSQFIELQFAAIDVCREEAVLWVGLIRINAG
jgi:hypothetical protein